MRGIAASLGITPTTSGAASVSGEITSEVFETLFGTKVRKVGPRPPGASDFGSPGGAASNVINVPEVLREYVESITVAPPHIRMSSPEQGARGKF